MKPPPFEYRAPDALAEAVDLLAEHGPDARVLAGGQSLVPLMNFRLAAPAVIVDLGRIEELRGIEVADGTLGIGAMASQRRVETHPDVVRGWPLLHEALGWVGHPQIRNRGTFGGSLAHADPAAELPAVALALGARMRARGPDGDRWIDADDFFVGLFTTSLRPGEILAEIEIPSPSNSTSPTSPENPTSPTTRTGWGFSEVARRHGDFALAGAACTVELDDDGRCTAARLALLGVGPRPVPATEIAEALRGEIPTVELLDDVSATVADRLDPPGDLHASADFRRHLGRVQARRALERAVARAAESGVGDPGIPDLPAPDHGTPDRRADDSRGPGPRSPETDGDRVNVRLEVNGEPREVEAEPRTLLSDLLRHGIGLTGTHVGCEHGVCGACTVLLDGEPVRSCLIFAPQAHGRRITTVEGLAPASSAPGAHAAETSAAGGPVRERGLPGDRVPELHPLQEAFREAHALQCGYCTPGFLMTLAAFLEENPDPDRQEVRRAISGNLCRCTGYQKIVDAALLAAERMRGGKEEAER